jgi:hypothetical protein
MRHSDSLGAEEPFKVEIAGIQRPPDLSGPVVADFGPAKAPARIGYIELVPVPQGPPWGTSGPSNSMRRFESSPLMNRAMGLPATKAVSAWY